VRTEHPVDGEPVGWVLKARKAHTPDDAAGPSILTGSDSSWSKVLLLEIEVDGEATTITMLL
jgi:hypothetical protein